MPPSLEKIKNLDQLVPYLREELDWPIEEGDFTLDELTYEWDASKDVGLKPNDVAQIREIRQLRPLETGQPWGIFFINLDNKKIPVSVLKRILGGLTIKKRQSSNKGDKKAWDLHDLLFISSYGPSGERELSFLHFAEENGGKNKTVLKELGWDQSDTERKLEYVASTLKQFLTWPPKGIAAKEWRQQWASAFTVTHGQVINTAKDLTKKLAELATNIRNAANDILEHESKDGPLTKIYGHFKATLFHNLTPDDFADMYAQTICYGLLSASIARRSGVLVADDAALMADVVTHPFLKDLMETFLAVGGRKSKVDFNELGIIEVTEALAASDMEAVLRDFGNRNRNEDPTLHFYEHFLKDYDGIKREQRGVYYTPQPIVNFIVRTVDDLLQKEFGLADGLADTTTWVEMATKNSAIKIPEGINPIEPFVQILDPATGTGTFIVEVIDLIAKRMKAKWKKLGKIDEEIVKLWTGYVQKNLLPRLNGFELMMAPYVIAHIKIGMKLHDTGYRPNGEASPRVKVFLTNTLEAPQGLDHQSAMAFISESLASEAKGADEIKSISPITVIIGNPPYSGISANLSEECRALVDPYRYVQGKKIKERSMLQFEKNIQDDYVKFFAYAEKKILRTGVGILEYVSNHSFLAGPTLRGMRFNLLSHFNRIKILDLHGDSNKKEGKYAGIVDHNIFNIKQGVAITALISNPARKNLEIDFNELWGVREHKEKCLSSNSIGVPSTLSPAAEYFRFVPEREFPEFWEAAYPVDKIFRIFSTGTETGFDDLLVDFSHSSLLQKVSSFVSARGKSELFDTSEGQAARISQDYEELDVQNASIHIKPFQLRAFDYRQGYLKKDILKTNSFKVMEYLSTDMPALVTTRQTKENFAALAIGGFCGHKCTSSYDRGSVFPLIIRDKNFSEFTTDVNFHPEFMNAVSAAIGLSYNSEFNDVSELKNSLSKTSFNPRNVFDYMYAILYSNNYRKNNADFLKSNFPRIPVPAEAEFFWRMVELGRSLTNLHLMDYEATKILSNPETRYVGKPAPSVERCEERYVNGRVMINDSCWFEDVTPDVWSFHMGGYQVCDKWLKDRAATGGKKPTPGCILTDEDILHYRRITVAIKETIRLMTEIDTVVAEHGGWPGAFYKAPPAPASIEDIIKADESAEIEYKSSFQWDVNENKKNEELRKSSLKTVVAFLNSEGGTLVIGVADDKTILGLEQDLKFTRNTTDGFERTFRDIFDKVIGVDFSQYCKFEFPKSTDDKQVCVISVEAAPEAAFLTFGQTQEFYIRRGNASKALTSKEQHEYTRKRFGAKERKV